MQDSPLATQRPAPAPFSTRWLVVLTVTILLHLILFNWAMDRIRLPAQPQPQPNESVISADLHTASIAAADSVAGKTTETPPRPKPARHARTRPPARGQSIAHAPATEAVAQADAIAPEAGTEVPGTSVEPALGSDVTAAEPASQEAQPQPDSVAVESKQQAGAHYKINPPPSAELKYDVQALRDGRTVYGRGKISWQSSGGKYTVTGEAGVLFFTVLNFQSEGAIDEFGVAPVIYREKRFRKSETNTHFQRERNTISFSASTASYPRSGGEQDRASIIWQLVAIGRGDSEKFNPGATIDLFVAGVRDAETWQMQIVGNEEIDVGTGKTHAWHVVRVPRPGSYDQKLDIWLAPQQEWYPVRLRYTEVNGDYLDMSLSNIQSLSMQ